MNQQTTDQSERMVTLNNSGKGFDLDFIRQQLKRDKLVLVNDVDPQQANQLIKDIAASYNLSDSLELQAAFASSLGRRTNVGEFYMTVEARADYHIVPPHSEGSNFAKIQLASFYCFENSTDGGESILMNVDQHSDAWQTLKELLTRAKCTHVPSAAEMTQARVMYRLDLLTDVLRDDDQVVQQNQINPNIELYAALAKPVKAHSVVADEELHVLWDSITGVDFDAISYIEGFLRRRGLFKLPPNYQQVAEVDWNPERRMIHSGINYDDLFKHQVVIKLAPRQFLIQNNFTWTHSVNNWTPGSGVRNVTAAFA